MAEVITAATTTTVNDLPDHLLLHIISFLPTSGDAIFTSSVSRKWRNLWLSTPSLTFYYYSRSYNLGTLRRFASFVDKTLIRRPPNSPLHTFTVMLDFNNGVLTSQLNSWIRYAISHDVESLELGVDFVNSSDDDSSTPQNRNDSFEFPFYMLRDSRVRVLKLDGCCLSIPSENRRFASIRSVTLNGGRLTDQIVSDLAVACVNLENLVLSCIDGCKDIKICSLKLKELTIEFMDLEEGSVEIVAPSLCALDLNCCPMGNFVLRDASSLVEAVVNVGEYHYWVKVMSFLGHVKRLRSPNYWFELVESKDAYFSCFILLNLKHVQLRTLFTKSDLMGILALLVLSPNLETMILDNCSILTELISKVQMPEESLSEDFFKQLVLHGRSLRLVKMKSFMGTECEKNFVIALLKMAVCLERVVLIPAKAGRMTPQQPIVLDPQFKSLQDLEYVVSQIPRWRRSKQEVTN